MMTSLRRFPLIVGLLAALAVLAGCGSGGDPLSSGTADPGKIVIGSANFLESELIMQMYAQALEAKGVSVETKPNIGSEEVYLKAFAQGEISLVPEYNGALLSFYLGSKDVPQDTTTPTEVYAALQKVLPKGAETLTQSAAEDKDTMTVTAATAAKYNLKSIADLAPVAGDLTVGAAPEFQERFQGMVGLQQVYGVKFKAFKPLDAGGPLTVSALSKGSIDVGNIFSTDSSIDQNHFVVLDDPQNLYLSQNILPLIKSDVVTPTVKAALDAVSKVLTTDNLKAALAQVQIDKKDPKVVAAAFLKANNLD